MNQIDEWTQLISKRLKSEAELVGVQAKHEIYQDSAKETFIRVVLDSFLPDNFAVGAGRVIDAEGNTSSEQDLVIYRRDYPQLNLPGGTDIFLLESVLATIQVKTKLIRKTLFETLDQCASMADLQPVLDPPVLARIAEKNNLQLNQHNEYQHTNPLLTSRFNLIGRPLTFVYAFNGYQTNPKQLKENIDMWIDYRQKNHLLSDMKSCATVIVTQGCFAARNASPFSSKKNFLFGIGSDDAPIRLIILQLMHALNRGLKKSTDNFGIKQGLEAYLNKIPLPRITNIVRNDAPLARQNKAIGKTKLVSPLLKIKATTNVKSMSQSIKDNRIKAPNSGLGSGIQALASTRPTLKKTDGSNENKAAIETVKAPPINPAADTDPSLFLQTMRIPKSKKSTDTAPKTTPPLPK